MRWHSVNVKFVSTFALPLICQTLGNALQGQTSFGFSSVCSGRKLTAGSPPWCAVWCSGGRGNCSGRVAPEGPILHSSEAGSDLSLLDFSSPKNCMLGLLEQSVSLPFTLASFKIASQLKQPVCGSGDVKPGRQEVCGMLVSCQCWPGL